MTKELRIQYGDKIKDIAKSIAMSTSGELAGDPEIIQLATCLLVVSEMVSIGAIHEVTNTLRPLTGSAIVFNLLRPALVTIYGEEEVERFYEKLRREAHKEQEKNDTRRT